MHARPLGKSNLSARTLTTPLFFCSGMGHNDLFYLHHVCVERVAPGSTEAKQKNRKRKTTCLQFLKSQNKIWQLGYQNVQATFFKGNRPKKIGPHKHRKNLISCLPETMTCAQHKLDKSNHSRWGSWYQIQGSKSKKQKAGTINFVFFGHVLCFVWQKTESNQKSQLLVANLRFVKHVCPTKRIGLQNGFFYSEEVSVQMTSIINIREPNC